MSSDIEESEILNPVVKQEVKPEPEKLTYQQFCAIPFNERIRQGINKKYPEYVRKLNDQKRQEYQQVKRESEEQEQEQEQEQEETDESEEEIQEDDTVPEESFKEGEERIPGQQELMTQTQIDVVKQLEKDNRDEWLRNQARSDLYTFHIQIRNPQTKQLEFREIRKNFIEPTMLDLKRYRDAKAPAVDYEADAIAKSTLAGYNMRRASEDPEYKILAKLAEDFVYEWLKTGCAVFFEISEDDFGKMKAPEIIANLTAVERRLQNPYLNLAKNLKSTSKTTKKTPPGIR